LSQLKEALYGKRRILLLLMLLSCSSLFAQKRVVVTGIVVSSESNEALPGVSVMVKGTTNGTTTDDQGRYTLDAKTGDTLSFEYIGFIAKKVKLGNQRTINISLQPETSQLSEVVVTAFGTHQKKSDMVGSVTSISAKDLGKNPSSNLTNALAGRAAGVVAFQRSGEPGEDNSDFFIRGVTTFGYKTSPLILIDGIELTPTDLARIQPDDIASFTILKDATSTAVYGARGANGVILVTTKQGSVGKAKLALRIENSVTAPTRNVELADPVTYMKMDNEAVKTRDPLGILLYSEEKIANTKAGSNPIVYPANDWRNLMFKDHATTRRVNLNLSGGGAVARYFVSGSYDKDNGLLKVDHRNNFNSNIDLNSYTLRTNVSINVTKTTELIARLSGNFDDYTGPIYGGAEMYNRVVHANPVLFPAYYPSDADHQFVKHIMFGNYVGSNGIDAGYINPYADMTKGYKNYSKSLMMAQLELKQDLSAFTKGLSFRTMMNTYRKSYFDVSRFYNPFYYQMNSYDKLADSYSIYNINETTATEYLGYDEGQKLINTSFYLESMLNYSRDFKKHGLSAMLVYQMNESINANAGDLQLSLPSKNLGLSGRTTYNYDKRYYAEIDFGYNGSERFDENHRFGFFPSFGTAWTISNEKFFKPLKKVVSNLRLRATYGLIGNDAIGSPEDRFFYLSNVNMNDPAKRAVFGDNSGPSYTLNGISISRYSNRDITWEKATKKNVAIELGLFNKLNITAEFYSEMRDHILMSRAAIPLTMGLSATTSANVGEASGKGVDISMDYKKSFPGGWFTAMGNFTYATSQYRVYEEPQYNESYRYHVGHSIYQTYGYIAEKLFVDDAEAANSPRQNFGVYGGGDIKYLDVNRDGQITEADKVPIGNPTLPEIVYGFGFSMGYKSFDVSAFFQGLGNESFWINPVATSPFQNSTQVLKAYADSYWSEDHRDVNALWPRLSPTINSNNTQTSTWFMRDGSFLKLKQVEIGYTVPEKIQKKIHTSNLRIYLNASNLLTFSRFHLWDVEMGGNGLGYPLQKVINMGININFN
jgi:TonB-linked SusC/RagA family outer membrane protein